MLARQQRQADFACLKMDIGVAYRGDKFDLWWFIGIFGRDADVQEPQPALVGRLTDTLQHRFPVE